MKQAITFAICTLAMYAAKTTPSTSSDKIRLTNGTALEVHMVSGGSPSIYSLDKVEFIALDPERAGEIIYLKPPTSSLIGASLLFSTAPITGMVSVNVTLTNGTTLTPAQLASLLQQAATAAFSDSANGFLPGQTPPTPVFNAPVSQGMWDSAATGTLVYGCRDFSTPGVYTLAGYIGPPGPYLSCLTVSVAGVQINGAGKTVAIDRNQSNVANAAIKITAGGTAGVLIRDAVVTVLNWTGSGNAESIASTVTPNVYLVANRITSGSLDLRDATGVSVAGNAVYADASVGGTGDIDTNYFSLLPTQTWAANLITVGVFKVRRNAMHGGWTKTTPLCDGLPCGADDGLVWEGLGVGQSITDMEVSDNAIFNAWDACIENAAPLVRPLVLRNKCTTSRFAIGGWYENSLDGGTFDGNTASDVMRLFEFFRTDPLTPAESAIYFRNNRFTNNSLTNPWAPVASVLYMYPVDSAPLISGNNLIQNNNFGPGSVSLGPVASIVDGGGNHCSPSLGLACLAP